MTYETRFSIRQASIGAGGFTDIVGQTYIPIDCNVVAIFNNTGVDIYLRSDPGNAASQVTISSGQQFEIGMPGLQSVGGAPRFISMSTDPVCSLQSSSGTVTPLVECIR